MIVIPEFRDRRNFASRRLEDFKLYPEAAASLQRLKQAGFLLAVVTNQPDVRKGLIARSEIGAMHDIMRRQLPIDALKACYHRQDEHCDCRKPKPGMILEAAGELGVNLEQSFMVGDRSSDVAAGCATVFIDLGYAESAPDHPDFVVASIGEAADVIIQSALTAQEGP